MMRSPTRIVQVLPLVMVLMVLAIGTAIAQPEGDEPATPAGEAVPASASATAPSPGPTAATTAVPTSSSSPSAAGGMDGSSYSIRLRDLEQRIDELKEQIRRSHTRLSLLSDTIIGGGPAGSRAQIVFENEMSGAFRLVRAVFVLDGAVQYNKMDDTGALAEKTSLPIYSGSIPPGDHTLQVLLEFRGHGYGVFSYLKGYRFEVRSTHSFTVVEGRSVDLHAIAFEKGGVTTPLEERPALRYLEKSGSIDGEPTSSSGGGTPGNVSAGISIGGK